jgi:hypothetical protein
MNKAPKRSKTKYKAGWHEIGDKRIYLRSSWEVSYAQHLEALKTQGYIMDWRYEPKTFWFESIKRGVRSYKPDFQVIRPGGDHYWVEIKGHMDSKSLTKIKRFRKYYPDEELIVITSDTKKATLAGSLTDI